MNSSSHCSTKKPKLNKQSHNQTFQDLEGDMDALGAIRRRVVLVPYPYQGHITPMLQLGSILHSKGFSITVAHTEFNSPNSKNYPEFTFVPLPDDLAGGFDIKLHNKLHLASAINTNCKDLFRERMAELNGEAACIIYDAIMQFVDPVAVELKIPTIVLRTTNAAYLYMHAHFPLLQLEAEKVLPLPTESQLQKLVPDLYPLRFKDLPFPVSKAIPAAVHDFLRSYLDISSSSAVIWNTVEMLDQLNLNRLQQQNWGVPFFPIGPFHKLAPALPTSLMKEDISCLSWLDKQAPNSVIYVSLGSLAVIDEKVLTEIAWGLAKSEQPFLWVIRPSLVSGSEAMECLPEDFFEITEERGCIVTWAPQKKVLAHSSVGGFLTHCGWNSTLESMCEGVPVICRPCNSDQIINARYLAHVWKVGLELEQATEGCIEEAVRKLMAGEEGKEIRQRVLDMKQKLENTITEGGLSYESLEALVKFIITLSGKK